MSVKVTEETFAPIIAKSPSEVFSISITFVDPKKWVSWGNAGTDFLDKYKILFKNCFFEVNKYLIRVTPIRTGRLRMGWTSLLNKYNIDYMAAFMDTSLLDFVRMQQDVRAQVEGGGMSSFIDDDLTMALINNVPYGSDVEFGSSTMEGRYFVQRSLYKSEFIFKQNIDNWFKAIGKSGEIVDPPDIIQTSA